MRRFAVFAGLFGVVSGPWLVDGDFNMTPETVQETQWYKFVGGELVLPQNATLTCTAGKSGAALYDFGVASPEMRQKITKVEVDTSVPWQTHLGV